MRNFVRGIGAMWLVVIATACGKGGGDKAEPPKDPAQAALATFRDFVAKTYPATKFTTPGTEPGTGSITECEIVKTDVVKADSAASPFTGILEAKGAMYLESGREITTPQGQKIDMAMTGVFTLKFTNDGKGWECDRSASAGGRTQPPSKEMSMVDGMGACILIGQYCSGKAPTPK